MANFAVEMFSMFCLLFLAAQFPCSRIAVSIYIYIYSVDDEDDDELYNRQTLYRATKANANKTKTTLHTIMSIIYLLSVFSSSASLLLFCFARFGVCILASHWHRMRPWRQSCVRRTEDSEDTKNNSSISMLCVRAPHKYGTYIYANIRDSISEKKERERESQARTKYTSIYVRTPFCHWHGPIQSQCLAMISSSDN